jgi:hypothetical protein
MDDENKRIDIEDLPRAAEELTDEEARNVEGGLTKVGPGTLTLTNSNVYTPGNTIGGSLGTTSGNTIGGSLAGDVSDPTRS